MFSLLKFRTKIFFQVLGYILSAIIHTIFLGSLLFFLYYFSNFSISESPLSKIWVSICVDSSGEVPISKSPLAGDSKKRPPKRSSEPVVKYKGKMENSKKEEKSLKKEIFGHPQEVIAPKFQGDLTLFYPQEAQEKGMEGDVLLVLRLSQTGEVLSAAVKKSSGWKILDAAASSYAKGLNFVPCYRNGIPVEAVIEFPFAFRLKNDQSEI